MAKAIVTEDYSTSFKNSAQTGSVTLSTAETNVKINNKGVFAGTIVVTVVGFTGTTITAGVGVGTVTGTSKSKANNKAILLDGTDSTEIVCTGVSISTGATATETCTVTVNANQTSVTAD